MPICPCPSAESIVGKTASDIFAPNLAASYIEQDQEVLQTRAPATDRLERIRNSDGSVGWYLSFKHPLKNDHDEMVGMIGISQDLHAPTESVLKLSRLATVVDHIHHHLDQPLRVEQLARLVELSPTQFDRRMHKVFRLSAKQFIMKCRIDEASRRLSETDEAIGDIALACGFADQSAFTRQFKTTTGHPPGEYRRLHRK